MTDPSVFLSYRGSVLSSSQHPIVRHCPLCGIAMQAKKSRENTDKYDVFECLNCQTVISETPPRPPEGGSH
jgi:hypothetical protein